MDVETIHLFREKKVDQGSPILEREVVQAEYPDRKVPLDGLLGRNGLAVEDYTKAIEINPAYVYAYYYRANTRATGEKPDFAGAIQDYTKTSELHPTFADVYYYRANARGQSVAWKGDLGEVIGDYVKALEVAPKEWPLKNTVESHLRAAEARVRKYFDVTHQVVAAITGNKVSVAASNARFGDPALGLMKKLRVDYLERGEARSKIVDENGILQIVLDEGEKLIIKKALYGSLP